MFPVFSYTNEWRYDSLHQCRIIVKSMCFSPSCYVRLGEDNWASLQYALVAICTLRLLGYCIGTVYILLRAGISPTTRFNIIDKLEGWTIQQGKVKRKLNGGCNVKWTLQIICMNLLVVCCYAQIIDETVLVGVLKCSNNSDFNVMNIWHKVIHIIS